MQDLTLKSLYAEFLQEYPLHLLKGDGSATAFAVQLAGCVG
jgi:hypothetical protein